MTKIATLIALLFLSVGPRPDEGQWLPPQFRKMDWTALKQRGLELTKDEFWHPTKGGVLSAAVNINGCSASFISEQGLLVTNHHCGFDAVRQLSSVDANFLRDGFTANAMTEELPARGMVVYIVRKIEDVTERVHAARDKARNDSERTEAVDQAMRALEEEGNKAEPDVDCRCVAYFEGREYALITRTKLTDVRLVYAPPQAVGEFGGEVDNWMWPRHTGDFCFFRAYVSPEGKPAAYSKDNIPFKPEHFLKVSGKGVKEGDLVMILGYPGRTERYLSSVAVQDRKEQFYPLRYDILTKILDVFERAASRSERDRLRFASAIKSTANVQKNALGMVKGLARNRVVERKLAEEAAFSEWVAAAPGRVTEYGSLLTELHALDRMANRSSRRDLVLTMIRRYSGLLSGMMDLCAQARDLPDDDAAKTSLAARFADPRLHSGLDEWQGEAIVILLQAMAELPKDQRIASFDAVAPDGADAQSLYQSIVASSSCLDGDARRDLLLGGADAVRESEDKLVVLCRGLARDFAEYRERSDALGGRRLLIGTRWIKAQQEWRGSDFYPDANSTLRVSVASVKGYQPRDGTTYVPFTTLSGLLEKNTGEEPFAAPKALLKAAKAGDLGRFIHAGLGDVPVCFLADGDTTGGNSGSCVINGKGELVGLNFDRVFENVAGDFGWNPERSRNVSVDFRFVLWYLDRVQPAPHLIAEMGL